MTDRNFSIVHDPRCTDPLPAHTGNEWCISVKEDEVYEEISPAYYMQSVQGGQIADHRSDYLARYGPGSDEPLKSTVEDRRDNRDPKDVGEEYLATRNGTFR